MKPKYRITLVGIVLVIVVYGFTALVPIKKTAIKLIDKDKASCGYYRLNTKMVYFLYDGTVMYNTDSTSCRKLKNKNTIDNIIIIDSDKKMNTAIVNSIGDDDNWYGEVKDNFKQVDKINY